MPIKTDKECFLCGSMCEVYDYPRDGDYCEYHCSSCGTFGVTNSAKREINRITLGAEKLGMLLTERKLAGLPEVVITVENKAEMHGRIWLPYSELISSFPRPERIPDRVLLNLANSIKYITEKININTSDRFVLFAFDTDGIAYICKQLNEMGFVTPYTGTPSILQITASGWERVNAIRSGHVFTEQIAFAAMWFNESTDIYYEHGIKRAIESDGVTKCVRIDRIEHNNKICDEIIKAIRNSRFVVADFTGNRCGVYFEAGYALGIGLPVIYTVHKNELESVHFDTRQYNHIVYETSEELYEKLNNRIAATIVK